VESTLDIEPLLELLTRGCFVDKVDQILNLRLELAVHLVVPAVGIIEGCRRLTGRSHEYHRTKSTLAAIQRAPRPSWAQKNLQ
jgi:hypothetical protein